MALAITHSTPADGTFSASGLVAWDAAHTLTGTASVAQGGTGLSTIAAGSLLGANALDTQTAIAIGAGQSIRWNGAGTAFEAYTPAAAGASLDAITAAAADQAGIANADWNIRWNWAKVTNTEDAFTFGESAAATGGTSTSGVPNQVLLKVATLAASTMSPLSVYSRAAFVFAVSPTTAQVLAADGTAAAPIYSFASQTGRGFYNSTNGIYWSLGGVFAGRLGALKIFMQGNLDFTNPQYAENNGGDSGFAVSNGIIGTAVTGVETSRWIAGTYQLSRALGDAVGYAMNFRKARGTVASPTVITTADDLATISGAGYVGATGTYVEGCRITFDSTGTIANTTSGLGGIMRLSVAKVGTVGPAEIMRLTAGTTTGGGWATMNEADASPASTDLADGDEVAIFFKAGNICFAQNVAGTINYLFTPIDGSTATWTANTTGP